MKISEFIRRLERYKDKHGDLEIAMHERIVNPNYMNFDNKEIRFYKSWFEKPIFSKEEIDKMSRRTLLKKAKEFWGDELVTRGITDEELREILADTMDEEEILSLGIDGE